MPHTVKVIMNIPKKDVLILNSFTDAYEGIGIVRTVDPKAGLVIIYATDSTYKIVLKVLDELIEDGVEITNIKTQVSEDVDAW
ncbi:MAG: DUF4911 domain-containing protein [Denitrovibrio sp.]|nr:MAG: DUF4911 domain-containing protein [Denitrovibrio sp.]